MKKLFLLSAASILFFAACKTNTETKEVVTENLLYFGDTINQDNAMAVAEVAKILDGKDSVKTKLTGTIESVCQKKGCWMKMNIGENKDMMVRFKDYGFFMPKDASGKTVVIEGLAFKSTTSVEELRHYAEDAGKSKEEIAKITEPETEIGFEANGVIIKN
jgi:hypothetical protein